MDFLKEVVEFIFGIALFINAALFIPQAFRIIKTKTAKDISIVTFLGFLFTQLAIVLHAIIVHDVILMLGYVLSMITTGFVLLLVLIYRKKDEINSLLSLEEIIEQLPGHIYWKNNHGEFIGSNTANWKDFGFKSLNDYVGKSDYDILPTDDADRIRNHDDEIIRGSTSKVFEETCTQLHGKRLYLSEKGPIKNRRGEVVGISGISIDITDVKKNSFRKLEILENILAMMPAHVYWVDEDGVYQGCNDNQAKSAGLTSRKEIVGKTNKDLPWNINAETLPDDLDKINREVMKSGKSIITEEPAVLSSGEHVIFLSNKVPLHNGKGKIIGMVGISIDITDKKNQEKELIKAKEQAETASKAKTEFLYNMRHDIRTPFSGILGLTQRMADHEVDPGKKEKLIEIAKAADTFLIYLNEILEFTQLESGEAPIIFKPFDLKDLVNTIVDGFKPSIELKPIELTLDYNNSPEWVIGDQFRIQRILINLLSNAVKFTEKGYIKVDVEEVERNNRDIVLKLIISDTGIGIPKEKERVIFDKFTKLGSSYNTSISSGIGLGLQAVKSILNDLDADIIVKSEMNKGSSFICLIPFKLSVVSNIEHLKSLAEPMSIKPVINTSKSFQSYDVPTQDQQIENKIAVLLVEDNKIAQIAAASLLEGNSFSADVVGTGQAALNTLEKHNYDLILLDIGLPDINGYEVAQQIRDIEKEKNSKNIPIIVLSAHVDESLRDKFQHIINDCVEKPLTVEKIRKIKSTILNKKEYDGLSEAGLFVDWNKAITYHSDIESAKESIILFQKQCGDYIKNIRECQSDPQKLVIVLNQLRSDAEYCGAIGLLEVVMQSSKLLSSNHDRDVVSNLCQELEYKLSYFQTLHL